MVWDTAYECALGPGAHVRCRVSPHVAHVVCCSWLAFVDQRPTSNGLLRGDVFSVVVVLEMLGGSSFGFD